MTLPPFPTDEGTLDLIMMALDPGPEAERTSLNDLLDLMSRLGGSDPDAVEEVLEEADPYDSGRFGFDIVMMRDPIYVDHDVIRALITALRGVRAETAKALRALPPENATGSRDFGRGYSSAIKDALSILEKR